MGLLTHISLFSGVGSTELGIKLVLPVKTVAYCEIKKYCQRVLQLRIADGILDDAPIWDDVRSFPAQQFAGCDLISGGFPCQDISVCGKGAGLAGERSRLFEHLARVVRIVGPRFVLLENSAALAFAGRGLDGVLGWFSSVGYDAVWTTLQAAAVDAPHLRDRIWILAYASKERLQRQHGGGPSKQFENSGKILPYSSKWCDREITQSDQRTIPDGDAKTDVSDRESFQPQGELHEHRRESHADRCGAVSDADSVRLERPGPSASEKPEAQQQECSRVGGFGSGLAADAEVPRLERNEPAGQTRSDGCPSECGWWTVEPAVDRVAYGVAHRVDRIEAIGNGIVPQQLAAALVELLAALPPEYRP